MYSTLCFSQTGQWVAERKTKTLHIKTEYFCFLTFLLHEPKRNFRADFSVLLSVQLYFV